MGYFETIRSSDCPALSLANMARQLARSRRNPYEDAWRRSYTANVKENELILSHTWTQRSGGTGSKTVRVIRSGESSFKACATQAVSGCSWSIRLSPTGDRYLPLSEAAGDRVESAVGADRQAIMKQEESPANRRVLDCGDQSKAESDGVSNSCGELVRGRKTMDGQEEEP